MSETRYPTDMTDEQWAHIAPLIASEKPHDMRGRPRKHTNRELVNAIFYHERVGGAWRYLPKDFPHWNSVYAYFRRWSEDGTLQRIHDTLRQQMRRRAGKKEKPSALKVDSQSVKSTEKGGAHAGRAPHHRL